MEYTLNIDDRKKLVKRIEELTGIKAKYQGMPSMAYVLGSYTVRKDGTLEVDEDSTGIVERLIQEGMIKDEETAETAEPAIAGTQIALPLDDFTSIGILNLLTMLYSKGDLINKATGATFLVSKDLITFLRQKMLEDPNANAAVLAKEYAHGTPAELQGISFDDDKIIFTGFPDCKPAYNDLVSLMSKAARKQGRTVAKQEETENEKFAMRVFLIRLGMKGSQYKEDRKVLLANLPGSAAFSNADAEARWKEKRTAGKEKANESADRRDTEMAPEGISDGN